MNYPFDPDLCSWDRPWVGCYDKGQLRIFLMIKGELQWSRMATETECQLISKLESERELKRAIDVLIDELRAIQSYGVRVQTS
jgi:hypothetical protein